MKLTLTRFMITFLCLEKFFYGSAEKKDSLQEWTSLILYNQANLLPALKNVSPFLHWRGFKKLTYKITSAKEYGKYLCQWIQKVKSQNFHFTNLWKKLIKDLFCFITFYPFDLLQVFTGLMLTFSSSLL